jgi:5-oxopent-3-ene-1,2,5-tricarboxylate decarboxylase/2-hydroxyhepta-2,4-diene-1,7-dioate isomerase
VSPDRATAHPLGLAPSKIVAVHLNYRSRAEERGRIPAVPSYFLKPPSSLSWGGVPVVRPQGCELLAYEGEVAVIIGTRARNVSIEDALDHVGAYTAANDFGVYDFRWADRGSNLMSKGQDGFTPLGPALIGAGEVDPEAIVLRTYVNGVVVQEDSTANLLFPIARLVADLSRFVTLEPGDVILTGTPANSRPVAPGDVVEVEIEGIGRLTNPIVEAETEMDPIGAMPRVTTQVLADALGTQDARHTTLSPDALEALRSVSVATLTVQLRRRGIRNTFMAGLKPTRPDLRLVGYAYTLRYVPVREDIVDPAELNAQKRAIESIGPEEVLVIEARGETGAGTIGDILATRALRRGAAGIVTDGGIRDTPAVSGLPLPTYFRASHAAVLGLVHHPLDINVPVACAGVLVMPGDVIVGDAEGVLVLPAALAEEVARDAVEQERRETFALERIDAGESIRGLYPLSLDREAEYEAWRRK